MNELKVFENEEFGEIRTVTIDGEPWLVGKDVALSLGYSNTRDAINKHVDEEDKGVAKCDTLGGKQELTVINESGLYSLVLSSKLPTAKRFKRWVTSEVLSSLRKNGGYIVGQENMTPEEVMAAGLMAAQRIIESKDREIERMKPKEIFSDAVSVSNSTILIRDLAKILKQNGVEIGEKRLFKWMRENGYIIKRESMPTQKSMELGLFEVKETAITHSDGRVTTHVTPRITGKGQVYFVNKFLAHPISKTAV